MSSENCKQPLISTPYPSAPPPAYGAPTSQGYQPQPAMMGQGHVDHSPPPDYLALSIFTFLCCFWPLGLVGLIKAIDAQSKYRNGEFALAHASARDAKKFNMIGIGIGIGGLVFTVLLITISTITILAIAASQHSQSPV